ncbi:hypothetical protein BDV34DRAFT_205348 [Aspergillus parasiticus]|uniref:Uncharacterized protein n=1 Tax=Aspergillus parasiticus TaxID=5067 RepID=A0A5N6D584_ASPPA|nr:hypothetical protein BDV34DRAFT_205348 [Aspergillus parasiticus]
MERSDVPVGHKRPRTAGMYQRRRAVTACLPCRTRKTKCDNIRPACGFCMRHNAQCTYGDTANDHSSFDPASLAILDRVNHVIKLLETHSSRSSHEIVSSSNQEVPQVSPDISSYEDRIVNDLDIQDELRLDTPRFPATINNCEGILRWPIFHNLAPCVESFVFETENQDSQIPNRPVSLGRGIQEDDIIPLAGRFLSYVHIKNPILDVSDFTRHVRDASMNGLRWDGQSCLILLACALGCLAVPFDSMSTWESTQSIDIPPVVWMETGATYYLAAKKRLGLIEPSLLSIQCLFLCGVFEMYSMRALSAWEYFNQACCQLQNLFWKRGLSRPSTDEQDSRKSRQLEQRLYWSCMKSEFELRCEIPLPSSGISRFDLSDVLPSPPTELLSPPSQDHGPVSPVMNHDEEGSWFYYLAEISFRRIMNRAFASIGGDGEGSWITNFQQMRIRHDLFKEQIEFWYSHIPPQINLNQGKECNPELAHYIRARVMAFREWIHRPFLYYAIHKSIDDAFMAQAMPLARKCLDLCLEHQLLIQPHLHHGTWYVARSCMTRALLLIAAFRCGKIEMPENWREGLDHALRTLRYWATKSLDLQRAADVLQDLIDAL